MTGTVQVRPEIATVAEDGVLFADATLVIITAVFCYGDQSGMKWKCWGFNGKVTDTMEKGAPTNWGKGNVTVELHPFTAE